MRMGSLGETKGKETMINPVNSVVIELNRLENILKEKERELLAAQSEIKALKNSEFQKDKAVVELSNELTKLELKLRNTEKQGEDKNIEIKKLNIEKKEALTAQFAAEATLRRVHANLKDEEPVSIEAIIAPYESDIKRYESELVSLKENKKAYELIIKSKDVALLEAAKILHSAHEKVMTVETLQNQNSELKRRTEIYQEENKLLEKANRQKVIEVEKLSQTIRELEESILAGGAVANVVRDYQRHISELNEEKKTLERELARAKVSVNRVAKVAANEWKDEGDKVIPSKQWIEERKFMQGEIRRLKEKLAMSERTIRAETQLKDKFKLRLKIVEEGLNGISTKNMEITEKPKTRSISQPRASILNNRISISKQTNLPNIDTAQKLLRTNSLKMKFASGENLVKKNMWASSRKSLDNHGKENTKEKTNFTQNGGIPCLENEKNNKDVIIAQTTISKDEDEDEGKDMVSGVLYDRLQKEVINLRKLLEQREGELNEKDEEIKILQRKIDTLTKAMEVELKKLRREAAAKEKETVIKTDDNTQKSKTTNISKRFAKFTASRT